ncbi:MAG TPA: hypothetical protein VJA27_00030 [Patescibacteria group bacterium]|nr:hypothetical protein [Patescibacteria group bacterium]
MGPQEVVLRAYHDLFQRELLLAEEQKLLRLDAFFATMPTELVRFVEIKFLAAIGTFFRLRNDREVEAQELAFTTEVSDILYQMRDRDVESRVAAVVERLSLNELHIYMVLALYVKHLGLCHAPPILRWHEHERQTLVWDQEAHRLLLGGASSVRPT